MPKPTDSMTIYQLLRELRAVRNDLGSVRVSKNVERTVLQNAEAELVAALGERDVYDA